MKSGLTDPQRMPQIIGRETKEKLAKLEARLLVKIAELEDRIKILESEMSDIQYEFNCHMRHPPGDDRD